MNSPWYRTFFTSSARLSREIIQAKADQGDAEAQFSLGLQYAVSGTGNDYIQAAQWYLKAAHQDHPMAQFNLAIMNANGQGMAENNTEALLWFNKAALLGDAGAQHQLGMEQHRASLHGTTVTAQQSRIEAYKWFRLAATQNYRGSMSACEQMALRMTREDVTEGDNRAVTFVSGK